MSMGMEVGVFLAYAMAVLLVYIAGRYLLVPLKWLIRLVVNSLAGGVVIILINYFGAGLGLFVPLNLITAVIAGMLGIPGVVAVTTFFNI